ncbi:MAG TPA: chorismate mutase [Acidimicrobiia bacterium]|nr:chorismate mutase [Acidimicrobiia bacterium]
MLALRGATTVDADTKDEIDRKTQALVQEMVDRNGVDHDNIVSVFFNATPDLHSQFPATSVRAIGFGDIPLICAQELQIDGSLPMAIRVLMHLYTDTPRDELRHVYLEGARVLRDDLPE